MKQGGLPEGLYLIRKSTDGSGYVSTSPFSSLFHTIQYNTIQYSFNKVMTSTHY